MGTILSRLNEILFGKSRIGINDLNDDVLLIIFSYLNLKERIVVSGVSIRWSILISKLFRSQSSLVLMRHSDLQWKYCCSNRNLDVNKTNSIVSLASNSNKKFVIEKLLSMSTNLKSIDFVGLYFEKNLTPLRIIMNSCDSDLVHCNFFQVLNDRNNLQDVRISISADEMTLFVTKYPNIRYFGTDGSWFRFTKESLTTLMMGFKDLEVLSLAKGTICDSETEITGDYFYYISKNISTLKVTQQILGTTGLFVLCQRLESIVEFRVDSIASLTDIKLISEHFTNLKCLSFKFCIPKENQTQAFIMLSHLTNLEELDISISQEFEQNSIDSDLIILMSKCHLIKKFKIKGSVTDDPIKMIDICWPKLEKLSIIPTHDIKLTDESVPKIAKLQSLTHLDVRNSRIGDQLVHVINSCENLCFINVCGSLVTDVLLQAFINVAKANPKLEYQIKRARTNITQKYNHQLQFPTNLFVY